MSGYAGGTRERERCEPAISSFSLFPSSRSGQFRIFNWTTRYLLPILSFSALFFPVRAIPTDWLGHFTSLLSENFVKKSVALLSGHVYIISRRA